MVHSFSILRSIQNLRTPSFFPTNTTALANGLGDLWIAPISNISWIWALMLSYIWGGMHLYCSLKGICSVSLILCLIRAVLPRSRLLCRNRCSHLSSSSLAHFCSDSGHSFRPWRSKASKTHPFGTFVMVPWAAPGQVDHWWYLVGRDYLTNHCFGTHIV